tara:strand:- start:507 stop:839 length:333 start_codon:yes stop_codon:yes gene_type:complete
MKNPWRNPLKPLFGCVALLTAIGTFIYANVDHQLYYQSNHDGGLKNDCMFTNEDYAFTLVYCGNDWVETTFICNYYLPSHDQGDCIQLSSAKSRCNDHRDELELIHACHI